MCAGSKTRLSKVVDGKINPLCFFFGFAAAGEQRIKMDLERIRNICWTKTWSWREYDYSTTFVLCFGGDVERMSSYVTGFLNAGYSAASRWENRNRKTGIPLTNWSSHSTASLAYYIHMSLLIVLWSCRRTHQKIGSQASTIRRRIDSQRYVPNK